MSKLRPSQLVLVRSVFRHSLLATRHFFFFFVLACTVLLCARSAFALDPSLDISQYAHTAWRIRDGFTKGTITSIAQTPDGYLWLGTDFGLYRFDGVRAVLWQPASGERLHSMNITRLLVSRDGTLWIGTLKGLASWKDGKLRGYSEINGTIASLIEDHEGTAWAGEWGTGPGSKLCSVRNGTVVCYGKDGSLGPGVLSLYEDNKGDLWAGAAGGFWQWKPGPPKFYAIPGQESYTVQSFVQDQDGSLLIAAREIMRFSGGKFEAPSSMPPALRQRLTAFCFLWDRDGALWVATTGNGLFHVHQDRTDVFNQPDGLSGNNVHVLFEDREGNLWAATTDGLDRFRDFAIPTWSAHEGLSVLPGGAVLAAADGTVWVGGKGLQSLKRGRLTIYRSRPEREARAVGQMLQEKIDNRLPENPFGAIFQDHSGRLWISSRGATGYFENEQFHPIRPFGTRFVLSIDEDATGDLWFGAQQDGLLHFHNEKVVQKIPWDRLGLKDQGRQLVVDRLKRGMWIGFLNGGVGYFRDGQLQASYSPSDGFGEGVVNDLRLGPRGTLWAGTDGGLSRIKDGHAMTLTSKNGLPCDLVHWSIEDNDHFVWLYMPCGLVRIARSELDEWTSDPERRVQFKVFEASDGVRTVARYTGFSPQVSKAPDGRIWFAAMDGVSVIDPRHLRHNVVPPPVHIEQVTADRKVYDTSTGTSGHLRLPPLIRDLEIDYTALSLVAPEKVGFRYMLEGWDRDWQDAGNRRQAFYSNLPPRRYRFRVAACNNSGVWNEEGAALDFAIAPAYYQANWFRALCVAAFMALLWAFYQLRLRQLAREFNMRLDERVSERTRIARELHDTLLQSFHGVLLLFQAVANELQPGKAKQRLENAIDRAAEAITEGRDAVTGLRASAVERNDLVDAMKTLGEALAAGQTNPNPVGFCVAVEGTSRDLRPILRDEVYRIAVEAVRNAFRHADAKKIEVEIHYDDRRLRVRVRDDGKGIDPKLLGVDGRERHFGLLSMRERAKLIGGKLTVWSELEAGTEVELSIPAERAYTTSTEGLRSWFAKKISRKQS